MRQGLVLVILSIPALAFLMVGLLIGPSHVWGLIGEAFTLEALILMAPVTAIVLRRRRGR